MSPDDDEIPSAEDLARQFREQSKERGPGGEEPPPDDPDPTQEQLLRLWNGTDPEERRKALRAAAIGEAASRAWTLLVAGLHEQGIELGTAPVILGDGLLVTESGEWIRDPEEVVDERVSQVKTLEDLMAKSGLSAAAVADRLEVSVSTVRSWLARRALPGHASQQALQGFIEEFKRGPSHRSGRRRRR